LSYLLSIKTDGWKRGVLPRNPSMEFSHGMTKTGGYRGLTEIFNTIQKESDISD